MDINLKIIDSMQDHPFPHLIKFLGELVIQLSSYVHPPGAANAKGQLPDFILNVFHDADLR